jgi:excisionase family DNA binding protein
MDKLLLTLPEVCQQLGLGRSKVYELMHAGELRYVKIGKSVRFLPQEIEAFVTRLCKDVSY